MSTATKLEIPSFEEFRAYAYDRIKHKHKEEPENYSEFITDKYDAWESAGWMKEKKGKYIPILKWKTTLIQTLTHRIPNKVKNIRVRAEVIKPTGKMAEIENEIIISAFNHFKVMSKLKLKHDECYDFLLERGVFKKGTELSEKTGKPWQEWYDKLFAQAQVDAVSHAVKEKFKQEDLNRIRRGEDPIIGRFVKLQALETYFKKFDNEDRIKAALNN